MSLKQWLVIGTGGAAAAAVVSIVGGPASRIVGALARELARAAL